MTMQTFALSAARLAKYKGQILAHAVSREVLGKAGRQVTFPKNNSDTYVARRWLPYGATATQPNRFFSNGTGDRSAAMVQAHQTSEGVTSVPESITPQDVTVVLVQYNCLYGFTDKAANLYEDDIPAAMIQQTGERVTLVNEQIIYGALKACTNQFYGGTGTSRATVNGAITLGMVRKMAKSLSGNHADTVTKMLSASALYNTEAVEAGYFVYASTDLAADIRDLTNFVPAKKYASGKPMPHEIGACEEFRFILTPDFPSIQDAGAAIGSLGLDSTTGVNIDVYQFIVTAADAWSQVAVRGLDALDPTYIPTGMKSPADPHGQRGYAGTMWWKAVMIENDGWMAVGNVGARTLT